MSFSVKSLEKVVGLSTDHVAERLSTLTRRETEVVGLLADGLHPRKIAAGLGISIKTLDVHRNNVKTKLGVKTTVDVARYVLLKRIADAMDGVRRRAGAR